MELIVPYDDYLIQLQPPKASLHIIYECAIISRVISMLADQLNILNLRQMVPFTKGLAAGYKKCPNLLLVRQQYSKDLEYIFK